MLESFGRAVAYLIGRYVFRRKYMVATATSLPAEFRFITEDVVGRRIYKDGIYDERVTRYLRSNLKPKTADVLLDIGANIGWYSILLDGISPDGVDIFAFEPDELNFGLLSHNLATNRSRNVTPVNLGLAEDSGSRVLYLYPNKNRGRHSLLPLSGGDALPIQTISVDQFWKERQLGDRILRFAKIDVEGYEYFVICGGSEVFSRCAEILMEYSPELMNKGRVAPQDIIGLLVGFGLIPHLFGKSGLQLISPESLGQLSRPVDVLWKRPPRTSAV